MNLEYYVLNEKWNHNKVERINIFDNYYVKNWTEKEVKKYLRAPSKYKYIKQYENKYHEEIVIYGFDAFCAEVKSILMYAMWAKCEYEILVGTLFTTEIYDIVRELDKYETFEDLKNDLIKESERNGKLQKIDCFYQCELNIPVIAREIIYQAKQEKKNGLRSNKEN